MKIRVYQRSVGYYLPIRINGRVVQTENPRVKTWPKWDGKSPLFATNNNPHDNLPPGFKEP